MGVAHVGLVNRDPCECKVKGFCAVSSIEWNVSKRRHLQGVRQPWNQVDEVNNAAELRMVRKGISKVIKLNQELWRLVIVITILKHRWFTRQVKLVGMK